MCQCGSTLQAPEHQLSCQLGDMFRLMDHSFNGRSAFHLLFSHSANLCSVIHLSNHSSIRSLMVAFCVILSLQSGVTGAAARQLGAVMMKSSLNMLRTNSWIMPLLSTFSIHYWEPCSGTSGMQQHCYVVSQSHHAPHMSCRQRLHLSHKPLTALELYRQTMNRWVNQVYE